MLVLLIITLVFSAYYYVESFKSGLSAKKWALAGVFLGPTILPMFNITRRVKLRHAQGFSAHIIYA